MTDSNKPIMQIDKYGNKYWRLNDKLHREDGPAYEYADGSKEWWVGQQDTPRGWSPLLNMLMAIRLGA